MPADIIPFPRVQQPVKWRFVTITRAHDVAGFDVKAWSARPSDPTSIVIHMGWAEFHPEAYDLALEKARLVGVSEILDATTIGPAPDDAA